MFKFGDLIPLDRICEWHGHYFCCHIPEAGRGGICSGILWADGKAIYAVMHLFFSLLAESSVIWLTSEAVKVYFQLWSIARAVQLSSPSPAWLLGECLEKSLGFATEMKRGLCLCTHIYVYYACALSPMVPQISNGIDCNGKGLLICVLWSPPLFPVLSFFPPVSTVSSSLCHAPKRLGVFD